LTSIRRDQSKGQRPLSIFVPALHFDRWAGRAQANWNQFHHGVVQTRTTNVKRQMSKGCAMPILIWIATVACMLEMSGIPYARALPKLDHAKESAAPRD
jgi:hypothetical protein